MLTDFVPLRKVLSVPSDATAFRSRGPQHNVVVKVAWKDITEDKAVLGRKITHELADIFTSVEDVPLEHENYGYGNLGSSLVLPYGSIAGQHNFIESDESWPADKTKRLFGANLPRLQQIKAKYDPDMVFHKWFPIQPAKGITAS